MSEVCAARIFKEYGTMKEKMTELLRLSAARINKQVALRRLGWLNESDYLLPGSLGLHEG